MKRLLAAGIFLFLLTAFACKHTLDEGQPFVDGEAIGCGDFVIYKKISADKLVHVWLNHNETQFSTSFQTFNNIANQGFAEVGIYQNCDMEGLFANVCNDVLVATDCETVNWTLVEGKLSYKVSEVLPVYGCSQVYYATVILENAVFKKENSNETLTVNKVVMENVQVGWCAG